MTSEFKPEFIKITYNDGNRKFSIYVNKRSESFEILKEDVAVALFDHRNLPRTELKTFWIDWQGDNIDLVNEGDYYVFRRKNYDTQHIYVEPCKQDKQSANEDNNNTPNEDDPAAFVIHEGVECDSCGSGPIVGFRYKCIQCPNFDLCQRCEAQHKHPEHMMVRMPKENSPTVIDSWISSPCGRDGRPRSKRERKRTSVSGCPFFNLTSSASAGANPNGEDFEANIGLDNGKHHHHHERKHQRRQMRHGFLSNMYEMMSDFAEGGAAYRPMGEDGTSTPTSTAPPKADESATTSANDAAKAACEAAKLAAEAATKIANDVATKVAKQATAAADQAAEQVATDLLGAMAASSSEQQGTEGTPKTSNTGTSTPLSPNSTNNNGQSSSTNNPIPTTPTLEDIAQLIDPKIMKAGIELLSNFSGMFAKMIDPMDGDDGFQARKGSEASSTTSSNPGMPTQSTIPVNTKSDSIDRQAVGTQEHVNGDTKKDEAAATTTAVDNVTTTTNQEAVVETEKTTERRRTQSEESDWQLIDRQAAESTINLLDISASSTTDSIEQIGTTEAAEAASATPTTAGAESKSPEQNSEISFEKLNLDLKNHIQLTEKKLKIADILNLPKPNPYNTGTTPKTTQPNPPTTTYHQDTTINNAIHAMMAMGFSNDGGWLTQLLESVNGNISAALDLMSPAQAQSNN